MTYRTSHLHVLGSTDTGKSKFLEHLIWKDIKLGHGGCLIDPHGTLYDSLTRRLTANGMGRNVICLDPGHDTYAPGFNPLVTTDSTIDAVVEMMIGAFLSSFGDQDANQTPLMERCMRALFRALAENKLTLLEALELTHGVTNTSVQLVNNIADPICRAEWQMFQSLSKKDFAYYFHSTHNRLSRFLASERIRNIVAQNKTVLNTQKIMDEQKFLLVNLSRSTHLHASQAKLLGTLLINDFFNKSFLRDNRKPFYFYIDECSHFVIPDVADMLAECRKFGLYLTLSHQTLHQIKQAGVYEAVMGNARSKVVFGGLSYEDAQTMVENTQADLIAKDQLNHALDKPTVTSYRRVWLENHSQTDNESQSESEGLSSFSTDSSGSSMSEHPEAKYAHSYEATGSGSGSTAFVTKGLSSGSTYGRSQSLEPVLQTLPTQMRSVEDKKAKAVAQLMRLPKRRCLTKPAGRKARFRKVPFVPSSVANTRRMLTYQTEKIQQSGFAQTIPEVTAEIEERKGQLIEVQKTKQPPQKSRRKPPTNTQTKDDRDTGDDFLG